MSIANSGFREPLADGIAAGLIQQMVKLGAAQEKVLRRHGVLDFHHIFEFGTSNAFGDLRG